MGYIMVWSCRVDPQYTSPDMVTCQHPPSKGMQVVLPMILVRFICYCLQK